MGTSDAPEAEVVRLYRAADPTRPDAPEYDELLAIADRSRDDGTETGALLGLSWHVRLLRGDTEGALADLDRALLLDPDSARLHYNQGIALRRAGNSTAAVEAFRAAAALARSAGDEDTVDAVEHHLAELEQD